MPADTQTTPSSPIRNNPFRDPPVSPNPTGASSQSASSSESTTPSEPTAQTRDNPPSSSQSAQANHTGSSTPSASIDTIGDPLSEELPPAYTPAADVYSGEQSVEFGPRRPFQQAPPSHANPRLGPQQTGLWQQSPHTTEQSWTGYPGRAHSRTTGPSHNSVRSGLVPPPTHPLSPARETRPISMPPIPVAASDFARDFYQAGAGLPDSSVLGGSSEQYMAQSTNAAHSPASPSSGIQYNPPPGLPPRPSSTGGHTRSALAGAGGQSGSSSSTSQTPDDGCPTKVPTPGHPLLNRGNILVYPVGYECHKCRNTGYKSFDPTHPCKKCWSKYAKSYTGAITYTPWSSSGNSSSDAGKHFQRPLPKFPPPHQSSRSYLTRPVSLGQDLSRNSSMSRPSGGYTGASTGRVVPIGGGGVPMSPYLDPMQRSSPSQVIASRHPPPGAVVVQPGDPRIGGHLCWRCGGSGSISWFLFDESTCTVCNGAGRTF